MTAASEQEAVAKRIHLVPLALEQRHSASPLLRVLRRWLTPLAALMFFSHGSAFGVEIVRYPIPESAADQRYDYPRKLLELALSKTRTEYEAARQVQHEPDFEMLRE